MPSTHHASATRHHKPQAIVYNIARHGTGGHMNTQSHQTPSDLPDIGTLWSHPKHGLMLVTSIEPLARTGFNEILYTVHVYRLKDDFKTEGIFGMSDWHAQYTHVA